MSEKIGLRHPGHCREDIPGSADHRQSKRSMTMKVLEKGRAQKGWTTERVCTGKGHGGGGCHAKLLVERDDIYGRTLCCFDESESYCTFMCPACGVETDFDHSIEVPFSPPERSAWMKAHGYSEDGKKLDANNGKTEWL